MGIDKNEKKIEDILTRGVSELITKDEIKEELLSGKKLRIKFGIDPTNPFIHIGRAVPLLKLKAFQELGHTIVFIIGDSTGVIGDTSDKNSERPMLTEEEIKKNAKTYFEQAGKLLDINSVEKHYNSEWLNKLSYKEIGEHANQFSVSDFIARENIKKRLEEGKRVSLREMLYPLMQGYDSVAVEADIEIGGTDQRFNLLAGRKLQEYFGQQPQKILMMPLITGTDLRKMSSSWGNTINITDEPSNMYGKVMSIEDVNIFIYFTLTTTIPLGEIKEMEATAFSVKAGKEMRNIKMKLAHTIVEMYHGEKAAEKAEQNFTDTFQKGNMSEDAVKVTVKKSALLYDAVKDVVESKSELRRLVENGAVSVVGGEKINDFNFTFEKSLKIKIGKRRFVDITVN